jgi:hypothetical protein
VPRPRCAVRPRRCSFSASAAGAVIQASISSIVSKIIGIAFSWIAPTSAFGLIVRNARMSFVVSPSRTFRTDVQRVQMLARAVAQRGEDLGEGCTNGALSGERTAANHTGARPPNVPLSDSAKLLKGTDIGIHPPGQPRQCDDVAFRTLVTPGSDFFPTRNFGGVGIPSMPWPTRGPQRNCAQSARSSRGKCPAAAQVAGVVHGHLEQAPDRLLVRRHRV